MPKITISYRRADSESITGRIFDRLVQTYGKDSVFRDVDNIPFGIDFRQHIDQALADSDIVVVVVGRKWAGRNDRIMEEADPVRIEVETAMRHGLRVVPVLVEGARMPRAESLPNSLKDFSFLNAATIDSGRDFDDHMQRLIRDLNRLIETTSRSESASTDRRTAGGIQTQSSAKAEESHSTTAVAATSTAVSSKPTVSYRYLYIVFALMVIIPLVRYGVTYFAREWFRSSVNEPDVRSSNGETAKAADPASTSPALTVLAPTTGSRSITPAGSDGRSRAEAFLVSAEANFQAGKYDSAVADYGNAIAIYPTNEAYKGRCFAHLLTGLGLEQALADCNESLRLQPGLPSTLEMRGLVNLKLKRFKDAIADFDAVLKIDPKVPSSLYGRGKARLETGDAIGGLSDMAAARQIDPDIAHTIAGFGIK